MFVPKGRLVDALVLSGCVALIVMLFNFTRNDKVVLAKISKASKLQSITSKLSTFFNETEITHPDGVIEPDTWFRLQELVDCFDRPYEPSIEQRGNYWVLYNLVRAEKGLVRCFETITYTTHGHFTFLDNVAPLVERWGNPVSVAVFAPSDDFQKTVESIRYLRDCSTSLIKDYVTFHVFFPFDHMPLSVRNTIANINEAFNCSLPAPYSIEGDETYAKRLNLTYPINAARNIARDSALTHYVLASDIELYPSPKLAERFMNMIARNELPLNQSADQVFALHIFEVAQGQRVPDTKRELARMLAEGTAIRFHERLCRRCHGLPMADEWIADPADDATAMRVFAAGKRQGAQRSWEPIFVGTRRDPPYDERLAWEGKRDKMTQAYAMCLLDYDFFVPSDGFLVHRPGIKTVPSGGSRAEQMRTNELIRRDVVLELRSLYGDLPGCEI